MNNVYITAPQFAKAVGVHVQTVRTWDKSGRFKAHHRTPGGRRFYSTEQVKEILSRRKQDKKRENDSCSRQPV